MELLSSTYIKIFYEWNSNRMCNSRHNLLNFLAKGIMMFGVILNSSKYRLQDPYRSKGDVQTLHTETKFCPQTDIQNWKGHHDINKDGNIKETHTHYWLKCEENWTPMSYKDVWSLFNSSKNRDGLHSIFVLTRVWRYLYCYCWLQRFRTFSGRDRIWLDWYSELHFQTYQHYRCSKPSKTSYCGHFIEPDSYYCQVYESD